MFCLRMVKNLSLPAWGQEKPKGVAQLLYRTKLQYLDGSTYLARHVLYVTVKNIYTLTFKFPSMGTNTFSTILQIGS